MRIGIFSLLVLIVFSFFVTVGCTEKRVAGDDSVSVDTLLTDSTDSVSMIVEDTPMPVTADELFDDFFFNYAASKKVQYERTDFPMVENNCGVSKSIDKKKWKIEHFFMSQGYYTMIFSSEKEMRLMKDTAVNAVTVERIQLANNLVKQWHFKRDNGLWRLKHVDVLPLQKHIDREFLTFYHQFVSDKDFQVESLTETVTFTGPDPEDDFSTMTGEILPEQWPMFAPWMPSDGVLYNVVYGSNPHSAKSNNRYFLIRGVANGLQTDLQFVRKGDKWLLKKVTT